MLALPFLLLSACGTSKPGAAPSEAVAPAAPAPATAPAAAPPPAAPESVDQGAQASADPNALPATFCQPRTGSTEAQVAAMGDAWKMLSSTPSAHACDVWALVTDLDPKGLNVRAAPDGSAAIRTTVPTSAPVHLAAQRGAWFLVCYASTPPDTEEGVTLSVAGWVHGSKLGTGTRGYDKQYTPLLAEPRDGAAEVGKGPMEGEVGITDCQAGWLKVKAGDQAGWLPREEQCNNSVTTCP